METNLKFICRQPERASLSLLSSADSSPSSHKSTPPRAKRISDAVPSTPRSSTNFCIRHKLGLVLQDHEHELAQAIVFSPDLLEHERANLVLSECSLLYRAVVSCYYTINSNKQASVLGF